MDIISVSCCTCSIRMDHVGRWRFRGGRGECQPCSGLLTVYVYTNPGPKMEGKFHHKENIIFAQF